jgi:phosphoribosylanthranilate isomerase
MALWIKICANTTLADAQLAVAAGADAVGFVFAPSPRRVTPAQVAAITPHLPAVEKIGVFVDSDFSAIAAAVEQCKLTGVQVHGSAEEATTLTLIRQLRGRFGPQLRLLRVLHFSPEAPAHLHTAANTPEIDAILVDSRTATAVGGTGIAFDWQAARASIFGPQRTLRLIAAGGLSPANVGLAINILRPWGVDVASGVEAAPGRKDEAKVREFVANVRAAAHLIAD